MPSDIVRQQVIDFFGHTHRDGHSISHLADIIEELVQPASVADRVDAWIHLVRWTRGTRIPLRKDFRPSVRKALALERLRMLLDLLEGAEEVRARFNQALSAILAGTDATNLFGEAGLPSRRGFLNEFVERMFRELLPRPHDAHDLSTLLIRYLFKRPWEVERFARVLPEVFVRLVAVMMPADRPDMWKPVWISFADGFRLLAARVQAQGLVHELRVRSRPLPVSESPFFRLIRLSDALVNVWASGGDLAPAAAAWRWECQGCWAEVPQIRNRLETDGVSVDIVYRLEVIERCLQRMETMVQIMETPQSPAQAQLVHRLVTQLITASCQDRSLMDLIRTNTHLLHRKIVDRAGQTGEHYIASNKKDYWHIWRAGAGGGLLSTFTAAVKMIILEAKFAPFFEGLAYGLNYAFSFVLMQTYGLMLATKQPAMTAATLANIMRTRHGTERLNELVDLTSRIVHSQLAAALSNVAVVAAGAYALDGLWRFFTGHPFLELESANHIYQTLRPFHGGTLIFAALTGVILYLSSLVGGWVDNWSAYHRVPQGIADSPLAERFGRRRLQQVSDYVARNIGGWGTNISLGFMLGFTPAVGHILGVPLDVRHVTLSTGTFALSTAALGYDWFGHGLFLKALAGIGTMFVLNLGVSFFLSLFTAIRAYNLPRSEVREFLRRLLLRFLRHPGDFILPPRAPARFTGTAHG